MFRFYWAMEAIIAPGLKNSQFTYRDRLKSHVSPDSQWLDIGCGHQLLPEWMPGTVEDTKVILARCKKLVGIDRDLVSLAQHNAIQHKVCGELHQLPFKDEAFNLATANMVIEHIEQPEAMLREIARVLKPGGLFLFHTPNARGYSTLVARMIPSRLAPHLSHFLMGRALADVYPTFYRLNTHSSISSAAARTGLRVVECTHLASSAQARMLGPVVIVELLLIKLLRLQALASFRTNIIAVLQKPHR
jgi:ubiquinone/menaquinone biosynthesis C-methylase UbiE